MSDDSMCDFDMILAVSDRAIGVLAMRAERAEQMSKTLAGKVARFISFPRRVREAAWLPAHGLPGLALMGVGVLIQTLIVTLVTTVVGGVIVAALTKLWSLGA